MDQRRHSRVPYEVELTFAAKGADSAAAARSRDLSLGGMFVETDAPAPFGAEVTVRFRLPGLDRDIVVSAVVRWTKPDGMGLQFGSLGARETHAITSALAAP